MTDDERLAKMREVIRGLSRSTKLVALVIVSEDDKVYASTGARAEDVPEQQRKFINDVLVAIMPGLINHAPGSAP